MKVSVKKALSLLLAAVLTVVSALPVLALESSGYTYELTSNPTQVRITGYSGGASNVVIPETLGGRTVVEIGASAFEGNSSIRNLAVSSSVVRIMKSAFANCPSLESVSVPASVSSIADSAFQGCTSLFNVSIASASTTIGYYAFFGCTSLTNITIPSCVIRDEAFRNCTSLETITLLDSVQSVGRYAFDGTAWYRNQSSDLLVLGHVLYKYLGGEDEVILPEQVACIADYAFADSGISSVILSDGLYYVGKSAFLSCDMTGVSIPASVVSIDSQAFGYNASGRLDGFTVYCYADSCAYDWARGNGFNAVLIDNCSHSFGEWVTVEEPTCTEDGIDRRRCTMCNELEERVAEALGHTWTGYVHINDASCTVDGIDRRTCTVCGATQDDVTPAFGHSWSEWTVTSEPDCTASGSRNHTCTVCGYNEVQQIDPLGHVWAIGPETDEDGWTVITEPDCTTDGSHVRVCTVCAYNDVESVPALGHTTQTWTVVKDPTPITEGQKLGICDVCGSEFYEAIPVTELEMPDDVRLLTLVVDSPLSFNESRTCITGFKAETTVNNVLLEFMYPNHILATDINSNELSGDALAGTGTFLFLIKQNDETGESDPIDYAYIVVSGDVDGNGRVTAGDARLALRASARLETLLVPNRQAADVDSDSNVTASDARRILRAASRLEEL